MATKGQMALSLTQKPEDPSYAFGSNERKRSPKKREGKTQVTTAGVSGWEDESSATAQLSPLALAVPRLQRTFGMDDEDDDDDHHHHQLELSLSYRQELC